MNVTVEKKDSLNALLKVEIKQEDYQAKVEKALKDYRRKAQVPGFRPGHVPQSLIKKQYGKAILIEEVNHLLQHAVYDHIRDQNLDILGNPLPVEQNDIDWDNQENFDFQFELGLTPDIELKIDDKIKVPYYKIVADKKMIDRYVNDYAKRYGKMMQPEKVEKDCIINADFTEISEDGSTPIEGGLKATASFNIENIEDKDTYNSLLNLKNRDKAVINLSAFKNTLDLTRVLEIEKEDLDNSTGNFSIEIAEVSKIEPHALDQELFDKVYGEGEVNSEEEFRNKIREESEGMFTGESERKFYEDVKDAVLAKTSFELPDTFLKKWMRTSMENPMSEEEVEKNYPEMKDSMKWQLVENKVVTEYNIEVTQEDMVNYTKELIARQMNQYGQSPSDEDLAGIAQRVLENKDEYKKISDQLFTEKLISFFKEHLKVAEKEVSFEDFIKEAQKR